MTKEDKIQMALGLKIQCSTCHQAVIRSRVFSYNSIYMDTDCNTTVKSFKICSSCHNTTTTMLNLPVTS